MWFKALSFRDAIFQIINSLSAVGYGGTYMCMYVLYVYLCMRMHPTLPL